MIQETQQKETFIQQELKKFDVVEANLIALADAGKGLKIANIEDKPGIEAVRKARIAIKNERVRIEKKGKELRDEANKFNKAVLAKEKEYLAIIVPVENELQNEENKIEQEKQRLENERKQTEQKKIQDRISAMATIGYVIDYNRAASLSDVDFALELNDATSQYDIEQKRIADEREAARIENERLQLIAKQQEEQRKAFEAEADRIKEEQDKKQREIELAQQKIRLEQEAVERERKQQLEHQEQLRLAAEREQRLKEENERRLKDQAEKAEQDRLAAIEAERIRLEKEAAEKLERERLAAIEIKRQADLAPDKEKLIKLATALNNYDLPKLSMPEAETVLNDVRGLLGKVSAYINQKIDKL